MTTFWFCVHIAASLGVGIDAQRRGRSFIVWTLLTLIPYGIFVTWPLLYILPRSTSPRDVPVQNAVVVAQERSGRIRNLNSDIMGIIAWVACLLVMSIAIVLK